MKVLVLVMLEIVWLGVLNYFQADIISGDILGVLIQLPVLAVFLWYVIFRDKSEKERYEKTLALFEKMLTEKNQYYHDLIDKVGEMSNQVAVNTGAVNDILRHLEYWEEHKR